MNSARVAKLFALYTRGLITTPEIVNSLLIDLITDNGSDTELPSFVAGCPVEVRRQLRELLQEIQKADYRWKPIMLGPGGCFLQTEAADSMRLRRLHALLETA